MSETGIVTERIEGIEAPSCRHHWIIESPAGNISLGVCKLCGAEREFYNSTPETAWDSDHSVSISSNRWGNSKAPDKSYEDLAMAS